MATAETTTTEAQPGTLASDSAFHSVKQAASSVRVRIVVAYLILMGSALAVTVLIARQVQSTRTDRGIELDLVHQAEELGRAAADSAPGSDVDELFDTFLANHEAGDNEAFYTIPLDRELGEGIRRSFGAPAEIVDDDELLGTWTSVAEPRLATYATPVGDVRALVVPIVGGATESSLEVSGEEAGDDDDDVVGVFVAAHFLDAPRTELNELVTLLTLAALAVLIVTTTLAWSLAGRIIAPVRQLTRTARAITHSDLSARIPVEGRNEISELGTTFNEMVDRLERGSRAQRQFLDDIAHDLRTPLTIARGHLETLGDDPAQRDESMSIVLDELDRIGRAVSDLLMLAKAEQPDFLHLETVDYGDLAADVMQRVAGLAPRTWTIDQAPRPGILAGVADADRLLEAMLNLASNAVQHTTVDDEIGIGIAFAAPDSVRLWVRDRGSGIDVDDASVLFQRYSRGQTSSKRRDGQHHDGIGLGLSIVDAIARAHGGTASHAPTPGGGATFTMVIPLEPPTDGEP